MTQLSRISLLLLALAYALVAACTPHPLESTLHPSDIIGDSTDYEIYNATRCDAVIVLVDRGVIKRQVLARVAPGERLTLRVPPLPKGTGVEARAKAPDGTDCNRGNHIVVRPLPF
jgi:hypothetical protein